MNKNLWLIIIFLTIVTISVIISKNNSLDFNNHFSMQEMNSIRDSLSNFPSQNEIENLALDNMIQYAIKNKVWKHYYQRPNIYIDNLKSIPIWNNDNFDFIKKLENNFNDIEKEVDMIEFDSKKKELITNVNENIYDGKWNDLFFYSNGVRNNEVCNAFPVISNILDQIEELKGVNPGCVCLSFIYPGTKVNPHFGLSNNKLRLHLGIKNLDDSTLFVKDKGFNKNAKTLSLKWKKGKAFIFDDSFKHWVINESKGDKPRVILLIDIWHPDLNQEQKKEMSNDQNKFLTKYPFLKSLIMDHNVKTVSKNNDKNITVLLNQDSQREIGKYLTKVGIKHFHYDNIKKTIRVTYQNGKQEIFNS